MTCCQDLECKIDKLAQGSCRRKGGQWVHCVKINGKLSMQFHCISAACRKSSHISRKRDPMARKFKRLGESNGGNARQNC